MRTVANFVVVLLHSSQSSALVQRPSQLSNDPNLKLLSFHGGRSAEVRKGYLSNQRRLARLPDSERDDDNGDDFIDTLLLSQIPLIGISPVVPAFLGIICWAFLDLAQSLLAITTLGVLRFGALQVIQFEETLEEDVYGIPEPPSAPKQQNKALQVLQIDLVCLAIASGITLLVDDSEVGYVLAALAGLVLFLRSSVEEIQEEEQLTKDDKLLNRWDEKLQETRRKSVNKDDEI